MVTSKADDEDGTLSNQNLSDDIFGGPGTETYDAAQEARERKERRQRSGQDKRRRRGPLVLLATLAGLVVALVVAGMLLKPMVQGLFGGGGGGDYSASDTTSTKVTVTVPNGATGGQIATVLADKDVVKSASAARDALAANSKASGIQPGDYSMVTKQPAEAAVAYLADPAHRVANRITIREGLRTWEIYETLSKATGVPVKDFEAAAAKPDSIGLPAEAKGDVEGYLFPASYEFKKGMPAAEQLTAMVTQTKTVLTKLGVAPDKMQDTMILASIVESEGKLDSDKAMMARALLNRLDEPMRLQLNSTVSYGLKERTLDVTQAQIDDPQNEYNTYQHDGLPPGPIDNPGEASIKAAMNPADGPWLYWVTVNPETGETKFATTFSEHNKNVREYQQWCSEHKGVCTAA